MFRIAVLQHSPGVVYYHLLLSRETRIPGVAPFSFRIGIWDLFVHRGQNETGPGIEPGTFGLAEECSTTELTLLLELLQTYAYIYSRLTMQQLYTTN